MFQSEAMIYHDTKRVHTEQWNFLKDTRTEKIPNSLK